MRIAVAVDGSDNGLRAAEHSMMLAQYLPEAYIEIIYVADHNKAKDDYLTSESLVLKREQIVHPIVDLATEAGVKTVVTILKGNPSQEIIDHVNKSSVDQLVIGSRGLNVFQEMVLGSVSHKVMKHAKCPVTVVK